MSPLTSGLWELAFTESLRMSWLGSLILLMVLLLRIPMRNLPKRFSYYLWSAVWLRLAIPVALPSGFSFLGILSRLTAPARSSDGPARKGGTSSLPAPPSVCC